MSEKKNYYFASDTHFGSLVVEHSMEKQRKFVAWLESIKSDAKAIYLLGDIIDFWFEYKWCVPKGYTRFFGKLAELIDQGIEVHWFVGNHDIWLFDYLQSEIGVVVHHHPLIVNLNGKRFYMEHGDRVCNRSTVGRLMRAGFHSKWLQKLFSWLHPNWGIRFGLMWSASSRKKEMDGVAYLGEEREHLIRFAKDQPDSHAVDFFVFGHRHILLDMALKGNKRIIVLGDWLTHDSYAVWNGTDFKLEQLSNGVVE